MKYYKKIKGERIYLSPMCMDDAHLYVKWMNDSSVTEGLDTTNHVMTLEDEKRWLEEKLRNNEYQFAIVREEDDVLLGNCGIYDINSTFQTAKIGLFIGEVDERNKGYGSEAVRLMLSYAFNYLNLNNIMLSVFSFNKGAISCYKKVGFKEIGRRREAYYMNNKRYDEIYMDILKDEFLG